MVDKVKFVGPYVELDEHTAIKIYIQHTNGSAWRKIGSDIILLAAGGYKNVVIKINKEHPDAKGVRKLVAEANTVLSGTTVSLIEV